MQLQQHTTINMVTKKNLRAAIKELAEHPKLKDVNADEMTRALITAIVQMTDINDIKTLIELHRQPD